MLRRILLSCFMKRDRGVKDKGGDGGGICSLGRKMCARNFTCQPAPGHQPPEPASETSSSTFARSFFAFFCCGLLVIWNHIPETFFWAFGEILLGPFGRLATSFLSNFVHNFSSSYLMFGICICVCVYSPIRLFAYEPICMEMFIRA